MFHACPRLIHSRNSSARSNTSKHSAEDSKSSRYFVQHEILIICFTFWFFTLLELFLFSAVYRVFSLAFSQLSIIDIIVGVEKRGEY